MTTLQEGGIKKGKWLKLVFAKTDFMIHGDFLPKLGTQGCD